MDAGGWDEDGGSTFLSHHPVVGVPVVVGSTSCGEDGAKQQPQLFVIDIGVGVVESDQLRRTFGAAHSLQARATMVARGSARRLRSLRAAPVATSPTR